MSVYRDQIAQAVDAVEVLSPTRFAWLGEPSEQLPAHVEARLSEDDARGFLVHGLTQRLYGDFYCPGRVALAPPGQLGDPTRGDPGLVEALSAANSGRGCWEPGWSLHAREGEQLVVERGGLKLRAGPDECRAPGGGEPEVGAEVEVRFPKELLRSSPGFYMALVEKPLDERANLVRLYWNVDPGGAVPFVREATRLVNERGTPGRLKVANDTGRFDRCDSAVLYLARDAVVADPALIADLHVRIAEHLAPDVPALTRRVAPGLGLADDPGGGQSFGLHRCGLVAEGLARGYERGLTSRDERIEAVEGRLREEGLDPSAPYLRPGTRDEYAIATA